MKRLNVFLCLISIGYFLFPAVIHAEEPKCLVEKNQNLDVMAPDFFTVVGNAVKRIDNPSNCFKELTDKDKAFLTSLQKTMANACVVSGCEKFIEKIFNDEIANYGAKNGKAATERILLALSAQIKKQQIASTLHTFKDPKIAPAFKKFGEAIARYEESLSKVTYQEIRPSDPNSKVQKAIVEYSRFVRMGVDLAENKLGTTWSKATDWLERKGLNLKSAKSNAKNTKDRIKENDQAAQQLLFSGIELNAKIQELKIPKEAQTELLNQVALINSSIKDKYQGIENKYRSAGALTLVGTSGLASAALIVASAGSLAPTFLAALEGASLTIPTTGGLIAGATGGAGIAGATHVADMTLRARSSANDEASSFLCELSTRVDTDGKNAFKETGISALQGALLGSGIGGSIGVVAIKAPKVAAALGVIAAVVGGVPAVTGTIDSSNQIALAKLEVEAIKEANRLGKATDGDVKDAKKAANQTIAGENAKIIGNVALGATLATGLKQGASGIRSQFKSKPTEPSTDELPAQVLDTPNSTAPAVTAASTQPAVTLVTANPASGANGVSPAKNPLPQTQTGTQLNVKDPAIILGRNLTIGQKEAIKLAHEVGIRKDGSLEIGKDGKNPASINNYTVAQLRKKAAILRAAGINAHETRKLMEAELVGLDLEDVARLSGFALGWKLMDDLTRPSPLVYSEISPSKSSSSQPAASVPKLKTGKEIYEKLSKGDESLITNQSHADNYAKDFADFGPTSNTLQGKSGFLKNKETGMDIKIDEQGKSYSEKKNMGEWYNHNRNPGYEDFKKVAGKQLAFLIKNANGTNELVIGKQTPVSESIPYKITEYLTVKEATFFKDPVYKEVESTKTASVFTAIDIETANGQTRRVSLENLTAYTNWDIRARGELFFRDFANYSPRHMALNGKTGFLKNKETGMDIKIDEQGKSYSEKKNMGEWYNHNRNPEYEDFKKVAGKPLAFLVQNSNGTNELVIGKQTPVSEPIPYKVTGYVTVKEATFFKDPEYKEVKRTKTAKVFTAIDIELANGQTRRVPLEQVLSYTNAISPNDLGQTPGLDLKSLASRYAYIEPRADKPSTTLPIAEVKPAPETKIIPPTKDPTIVLGHDITKKQKNAIKLAHEEGANEIGKDGKNPAGINNYTIDQLRRKAKILRAAGFGPQETRKLMEAGVVGFFEAFAGALSDASRYSQQSSAFGRLSSGSDRGSFSDTLRDVAILSGDISGGHEISAAKAMSEGDWGGAARHLSAKQFHDGVDSARSSSGSNSSRSFSSSSDDDFSFVNNGSSSGSNNYDSSTVDTLVGFSEAKKAYLAKINNTKSTPFSNDNHNSKSRSPAEEPANGQSLLAKKDASPLEKFNSEFPKEIQLSESELKSITKFNPEPMTELYAAKDYNSDDIKAIEKLIDLQSRKGKTVKYLTTDNAAGTIYLSEKESRAASHFSKQVDNIISKQAELRKLSEKGLKLTDEEIYLLVKNSPEQNPFLAEPPDSKMLKTNQTYARAVEKVQTYLHENASWWSKIIEPLGF